MSLGTASLLPGLDSEITQAQSDTIWSATGGSYLKGVWIEFPYLYIPSFAEVKKQTPPRQPPPRAPRNQMSLSGPTVGRPSRQSRNLQNPINTNNNNESNNNNTSSKEPHFLVQLPPPIVIHEDGNDPWTLHCVCDIKTGTGLLVGCEKCGCWQHAICVGLNMHTIPENYICELCGNRPIRCKCNNNLNYSFSLIQCTQCGYYVHRRCVGLHYGPLPRGDFICNFCGKSKFSYAKTKLSHSPKLIPNEDEMFTFTQEKVENIPSYFLNGPFNDFLNIDIAEVTLNARDFCESFYDRFRSFFFICHPLNPNVISRKKRNNLFTSFINGAEQLCRYFYHFDHQTFLNVFDNLIYNDIYAPFTEPIKEYETNCEITENTRFELARITNAVKLQSIPPQAKFEVFESEGLVARTELRQDQFVMLCDGLIGDLEEFNYDNGVSSSFFQIADTRLVLDTSHVFSSPLRSIHRSMKGNVVLKIILIGDTVHCGLFVGKASLASVKTDEVVISPGERLLFGIDFMPAVLEDVSKWIGYHCPEADEHGTSKPSSRDERERERDSHSSRQGDSSGERGSGSGRGRPKPQGGKYKTKKGDRDRDSGSSSLSSAAYSTKKPARNTKLKKRSSGTLVQQPLEMSLFDLFETENPSNFLFTVTDDVEEYKRRMEEASLHPQKPQQVPRRSHAKTEISSRHSTPSKSMTNASNSPSHNQHHNTSGNISSSSSTSTISQSSQRNLSKSSSSNLKNDTDDSDDNDDNDNSYYTEDDADEYVQTPKFKISESDSATKSTFIPRSGSAPNTTSLEKGNNANGSQESSLENQTRQHHRRGRGGRLHTRSHSETADSASISQSGNRSILVPNEQSSSPTLQLYNARDILKLPDSYKKQIKDVESTKRHIGLSIGDPVEAMRRLLNEDS